MPSTPSQSNTNALPPVLQAHFAAINRADLPGYLATFAPECTFRSAAATVTGIGAVELLMEPTFVETEPPKMLYRSHHMETFHRPREEPNEHETDHVVVQRVYTKVTRRISVMDKDTDEVLGAYDVDLALHFVIEDDVIVSCVTEPLE